MKTLGSLAFILTTATMLAGVPAVAGQSSRQCTVRGGSRSSAKIVWPVTLARPSTRRRALPTTPP